MLIAAATSGVSPLSMGPMTSSASFHLDRTSPAGIARTLVNNVSKTKLISLSERPDFSATSSRCFRVSSIA
jgi:hypothetical protein